MTASMSKPQQNLSEIIFKNATYNLKTKQRIGAEVLQHKSCRFQHVCVEGRREELATSGWDLLVCWWTEPDAGWGDASRQSSWNIPDPWEQQAGMLRLLCCVSITIWKAAPGEWIDFWDEYYAWCNHVAIIDVFFFFPFITAWMKKWSIAWSTEHLMDMALLSPMMCTAH